MIYILLLMYVSHGQLQIEQREQPGYSECMRAKQEWLYWARADRVEGALAYCVGRAK